MLLRAAIAAANAVAMPIVVSERPEFIK